MDRWSQYQTDFFEAVENQRHNLVLRAYAGTGKTTTVVEGVNRVGNRKRVLAMAFNNEIKDELQRRLPGKEVRTISSCGKMALHRAFGNFKVDENRTHAFAAEAATQRGWFVHENGERRPRYVGSICRLVEAAKNAGLGSEDLNGVLVLCYEKELDNLLVTPEELTAAACQVLEDCEEFGGSIDFADMAWLPYRLKLTPRSHDVVVIDEAQDLNEPQLYLVKAMMRTSGRVLAVGDPNQAIYQFRGAGKGMFEHLAEELCPNGTGLYPLPITYRCSRSVVDFARQLVPDYEAAPNAPAGSVTRLDRAKLLDKARPGDVVISRSNAPLAALLRDCIRANIPAVIRGRDYGEALIAMIRRFDPTTVEQLTRQAEDFAAKETQRAARIDNPRVAARAVDRVNTLLAFCEGARSVEEVAATIQRYFSNTTGEGRLLLTTTHKAKGLEWDNVYLLNQTYRGGIGSDEAKNLYYVAITRARTNLVLVEERQ